MSQIFSNTENSFDQSEISNKFKSVKQLLNDEQLLMNPAYGSYEVPLRFKGIILLETYNKLSTAKITGLQTFKNRKGQSLEDYIKNSYFNKWSRHTNYEQQKLIDCILTRNRISAFTFFYRIKTSLKTDNKNKQNSIKFKQNNVLVIPENSHSKKKSILKSHDRLSSSNCNDQRIFDTNKHLNFNELIGRNQTLFQQEYDKNMDVVRSKSTKKFTNQSLRQIIEDKVYKSFKNLPSLNTVTDPQPISANKYYQHTHGVTNRRNYTTIPVSFRNLSQNYCKNQGADIRLDVSAAVNILVKLRYNRVNYAWHRLIETDSYDDNFNTALIVAKRNLQLVQINFQIENQIQQINSNYSEQVQRLDLISDQIQNFQINLNCSRSAAFLNAIIKIVYPSLQLFFQKLEQFHYPAILQKRQQQKYRVVEMISSSVISENSQHRIQYTGFTSLNEIAQEDIRGL